MFVGEVEGVGLLVLATVKSEDFLIEYVFFFIIAFYFY